MAKGYWLGRVDVKDVEGMKQYASGNPPIFKKFGGRYLVRSDKCEVPEGNSRARHVVVEFPDYASAVACYHSPEYQANIQVRKPHAVVDLVSLIDSVVEQLSQVFMLRVFHVGTIC